MASNFYDNSITSKVTGTVSIEKFVVPLPITGSVGVRPVPTTVTTQVQVAATGSSVLLMSANQARKALWVYNYGSSHLCISLGPSAESGSGYFLRIEPDSFWELQVSTTVYTGDISGIWEPATPISGSAQVVELR